MSSTRGVAVSAASSARSSARQVRATRTRQALIDAALVLFESRGYDATSTEQIAEAAGVSPRTFFRYFPTKESVLLSGEYDFVRAFAELLLAQPDEHDPLKAATDCFVTLAPGISRIRGRLRAYHRVVASSLALTGRERRAHAENVELVAGALAARRRLATPDLDCQMLAVVVMAVLENAMEAWSQAPGSTDLASIVEEHFAALRRVALDR